MISDRLFVYGTLMRGFDHPMAQLLSRSADFLGTATGRGRWRSRENPRCATEAAPSDGRSHASAYRRRKDDLRSWPSMSLRAQRRDRKSVVEGKRGDLGG